jgi:hypothetical protein
MLYALCFKIYKFSLNLIKCYVNFYHVWLWIVKCVYFFNCEMCCEVCWRWIVNYVCVLWLLIDWFFVVESCKSERNYLFLESHNPLIQLTSHKYSMQFMSRVWDYRLAKLYYLYYFFKYFLNYGNFYMC